MKKSIFTAATAALFLIACKNSNSENNAVPEAVETAPATNDSAVKAHGHSHDAPAPAANDSAVKAHGHSHEAPEASAQDSIVKAHGHAH